MCLQRSHHRLAVPLALTAMLGCGGGETPLEPVGGAFTVGQSVVVLGGRDARIVADASGGEFLAVVTNVALDGTSGATFVLSGTGLGSPKPAGPFGSRAPFETAAREIAGATALVRDAAVESRLRDREQRELAPRFEAARAWRASAVPSLPATLALDDVVKINVNAKDPCTNPVYRGARVVAIGTKALILEDTLNPKPGFTTADYQRYAARFDTLVYPLMVSAFGEPSDIDKNGHVAIVFTRSVNELTPSGTGSYVSGVTLSRDLFPQGGSSRTEVCTASNEGEYAYLLAPDPLGTINGNRRTNDFVDTSTTTVLAHELVHLINASRKLYVNTSTPRFEERWLDEGLAHVGEELLFYRVAGLAPRQNLTYQALRSSQRTFAAYQSHMASNTSRYGSYLANPAASSPYAAGDAIGTRGAAWSLLRYVADRASASDGNIWSRLVDNPAVGIANLQSVCGGELASYVRDWSVSHALDDVAAAPAAAYQQRSWNFHSVFAGVDGLAALYPLQVAGMTPGTAYTGSIVAGGAQYFKLTVPANGTATLAIGASSGTAAGNLQLVLVRTK
jgi:hypothetical protein